MSQKRKRAEISDGDHASREAPRKKQFKSNKGHSKSKVKQPQAQSDADTASTNTLKNRIRDLKRLLQHVNEQPKHKMPANVRIERERELETCEHELAEKQAARQEANRRSKMISKYHHVRFFGMFLTVVSVIELRQASNCHQTVKRPLDRSNSFNGDSPSPTSPMPLTYDRPYMTPRSQSTTPYIIRL
jgi:predicted RNase H-like nuclease (RuvC/YqgF family)